jgi:hypothetical protein
MERASADDAVGAGPPIHRPTWSTIEEGGVPSTSEPFGQPDSSSGFLQHTLEQLVAAQPSWALTGTPADAGPTSWDSRELNTPHIAGQTERSAPKSPGMRPSLLVSRQKPETSDPSDGVSSEGEVALRQMLSVQAPAAAIAPAVSRDFWNTTAPGTLTHLQSTQYDGRATKRTASQGCHDDHLLTGDDDQAGRVAADSTSILTASMARLSQFASTVHRMLSTGSSARRNSGSAGNQHDSASRRINSAEIGTDSALRPHGRCEP